MYKLWLFSSLLFIQQLCWAQQERSGETRLLEIGKPVERQLPGGGLHAYNLSTPDGALLRIGIEQDSSWLVMDVYGADGIKLQEFIWAPKGNTAYTYTSARPYTIMAKPLNDYRLELRSPDPEAPARHYRLHIEQLPDSAWQAETRNTEAARRWFSDKAIPIRSLTAGNGFEDLQPLRNILKEVQVVGLGEATHGSREFFQFKHRMLEFLVREMGFTVFGIEASAAACERINDYVLYGRGDGKEALAGQGFWQWNTEEVSAMIEWIREYNRAAPESGKIKFYGFDFQANDLAIENVLSFLKKVAPERVDSIAKALVYMQMDNPKRPTYVKYFTLKPEEKAPIVATVNELFSYLAAHKNALATISSLKEFNQAYHHVRLLSQFADSYSRSGWVKNDPESGVATRDRYMAENIGRILEAEGEGARMVIWTHNGHASTAPYDMGYYLRKALGKKYYAFGFLLNQGSFQALEIGGKGVPEVKEFSIGPAYQSSVDWLLNRAGPQSFAVDLRGTPAEGPVADWLAAPHAMRSIGNGFAPGNPSGYYNPPVVLKHAFDGLLFIKSTTRARPNTAR